MISACLVNSERFSARFGDANDYFERVGNRTLQLPNSSCLFPAFGELNSCPSFWI
jgi:hypothetical protein